jgi:hypothetical protein
MTNKQIRKMRDTQILELSRGQLFWHYSVLVLLLVAPILTTVEAFKYYVLHDYTGPRPVEDLLLIGYLPIIPAIVFYFIQKRRLRFEIIDIQIDADSFKLAAEQTGEELEWDFLKMTPTLIVAKSGFSWRSWGELITIIREKDRILFNSICDPDNRPSVASWGMNKLNKKTFEQFAKKDHA